jgi:hypothetical protein
LHMDVKTVCDVHGRTLTLVETRDYVWTNLQEESTCDDRTT